MTLQVFPFAPLGLSAVSLSLTLKTQIHVQTIYPSRENQSIRKKEKWKYYICSMLVDVITDNAVHILWHFIIGGSKLYCHITEWKKHQFVSNSYPEFYLLSSICNRLLNYNILRDPEVIRNSTICASVIPWAFWYSSGEYTTNTIKTRTIKSDTRCVLFLKSVK